MRLPFQRYRTLLVIYLLPQWRRVLLLALLLLASIAMQLANPQLLRYFIDTAVAGGPVMSLIVAALLFIGIALANQALSVIATYISENIAWTSTNQLRAELVAHCLELDMAFHKAHTPGELIERIDGDVDALSNFFSEFVINLLGNGILLIGILVVLFLVDWRVGLAIGIFAVAALVILVRLRGWAVSRWVTLRQISADFFGFLGEQLASTEDIRASGATAYVMQRFYLLLRRWLPIRRKADLASYSMGITTLALFSLGTAVALATGTYLWSIGSITIGTVYLIVYYTDQISQPIAAIRNELQDLQRAGASLQRVEELLAILRLCCSQNCFGTVNDLNAVNCKNNELHFALIICRSICTSIERGERDACTKNHCFRRLIH